MAGTRFGLFPEIPAFTLGVSRLGPLARAMPIIVGNRRNQGFYIGIIIESVFQLHFSFLSPYIIVIIPFSAKSKKRTFVGVTISHKNTLLAFDAQYSAVTST